MITEPLEVQLPKLVKPIVTDVSHAAKFREWLATRGGIAVWVNHDLGSPSIGGEAYTPAKTVAGAAYPSPHWRYTNTPDRIVTREEDVLLETRRAVRRIKVRRGPPIYGGLCKQDHYRVQKALHDFGHSARWEFVSSDTTPPWFTVAITVATESKRLSEIPIA